MSEVLKQVSQGLVDLAVACQASVVRVEARQRLPSSGVVWSPDGLIVTASHTVEREHGIRVGLASGESVPARLVGRDKGTDLALLRAEAADLAAPAWATARPPAVGALVLALGRPGPNVLATLGVISAVDQGWRTPAGGFIEQYVQSDAVMYPGFSGGPLVGVDHQFIGISTSALVAGLSITVPAATVAQTVAALREHQRVRRGYLGVTAQAVTLPQALRDSLGQASGLLVTHVEPRSPAGNGSVVQGDTLVTLDGQPLRDLSDLMRVLAGDKAESTVAVKLVRGGQVRELPVRLAERAE